MSDAARAPLGMVGRGDAVPVAVLEELARAVLDADPIVRLALRVLDEEEPRRLARAIELAGVLLDDGASRELQLPVEERAKIITELIESVEDEPSEDPAIVEQAWGTELEARADANPDDAIDWPDLRAKLTAK